MLRADATWAQVADATGDFIDTPSMRQQYDCHVIGWFGPMATQDYAMDLEIWRPSNDLWVLSAPSRVFDSVLPPQPAGACSW